MVGGLHETPHIIEIGVLQRRDLLLQGVELREGLVLQLVAQPCRHVALLVGPRHHMRTVEHGHRLVFLRRLGHRGELQSVLLGQNRLGQRAHELEDARVGVLVLAERLVVHEQVHHLARRLVRREPLYIFVHRQRPLAPALVREAESDVVRELVVAQQQAQLLVDGVGVDVVGRFPAQHMLGAFGQHRAEAHAGHHLADLVRVDQLRIAERRGFHTELLLDEAGVQLDLLLKILLRGQRGQRVGVGLGQKLHASRRRQLLERVEDLGGERTELLDGDAGDRERAAEPAFVLPDELQQQGVHRQVALAGHLLHDRAVQEVIQIIMVFAHVEETVFLQTPGLMYLKIDANGFHGDGYFDCFLFSSITAS